ncbi:unnamed protein product [Mucor hiemalis]
MVRMPLYPEAENLIRQKKAQKQYPQEQASTDEGQRRGREDDGSEEDEAEEDEEETEEENIMYQASTSSRGKAKRRRRDTAEERSAKTSARVGGARTVVRTDIITTGCKYCNGIDHKSRRSRKCPGHALSLNEQITARLGQTENYTVSLPLRSFLREQHRDAVTNRIIQQCQFQRELLFKTMLFMNYYIHRCVVDILPLEFFTQNFIYRMALLVHGSGDINTEGARWPNVHNLVPYFTQFITDHPNVSQFQTRRPTGYSNPLSSACVTTATVYHNFFVESCVSRLEKFFFHLVKKQFLEFSKNVIDTIIENCIRPLFIENVAPQNFDFVPLYAREQFMNYFNLQLLPLKANFPEIPLPFNKQTFAAHPGRLLPIFRYIMQTYEAYHQQHRTDDPLPPLPKIFALHPNPSLKWKFMTMDVQTLKTYSSIRAPQNRDNTDQNYLYGLNLFNTVFNFDRLNILGGLEGLLNLPETKGKAFRNMLVTDGYTCVVHFSRQITRPTHQPSLNLEDFNSNEVETFFRPCTVDPGRTDAFTAEYPDGQSRSLGTHEYYSMTGSLARSRELARQNSCRIYNKSNQQFPHLKLLI